jgi:hypothetical protein
MNIMHLDMRHGVQELIFKFIRKACHNRDHDDKKPNTEGDTKH